MKSTGKETGGKPQICVPTAGFRVVGGIRLEWGSAGRGGFDWRALELGHKIM